jgi:hypothetical protein
MALLGIIRRRYLRDLVPPEKSPGDWASRNTVRRYWLGNHKTVICGTAGIQRAGQILVAVIGWFNAETAKPHKQRRNLKQIHEDLKELGYEGLYDSVRRSPGNGCGLIG